jgi:hypothetical protein
LRSASSIIATAAYAAHITMIEQTGGPPPERRKGAGQEKLRDDEASCAGSI